MNESQYNVRKKANDARLDRVCKRLRRTDADFKAWFDEHKELAREGERFNTTEDPRYAALRGDVPMVNRKALTGAQVNPLAFPEESLRKMHKAFQTRESTSIRNVQTKNFSTVDSLLPAELDPQVVAHIHEWRIMDHLPTIFACSDHHRHRGYWYSDCHCFDWCDRVMNRSGEAIGSAPVVTTQGRRRPRQPSENDVIFANCAITPREEETPLPLRDEPKKVRVLPPNGVAHDGVAYFPGNTPEVPASVADQWIRNRWVVADE